MPNVFREQAEERFHHSLAFLNKAESLLQDDLVNRSALADAVSAIKNMLQGYLLLRVSLTPESAVTQQWQEIAASNSMPDLLQACGEAGLDLRGLAVEIKGLNRERNRRMHDDPGQRIETQQARQALDLARKVQGRIKVAVQGNATAAQPEMAQSAPARIAAVARAAVSGKLGHARASTNSQAPIQPPNVVTESPSNATANVRQHGRLDASKPASAQPTTAFETQTPATHAAPQTNLTATGPELEAQHLDSLLSDESEATDDTEDLAAVTVPAHQRSRVGRALSWAMLVAAVLLLGVVAGAGLMLPIATGHAPGWLAFATQYLPAPPTATIAPTATATPTPAGPFAAGSLLATPTCASSGPAVTLTNSGVQPVHWSIGSPDGVGVLFALLGTSASTSTSAEAPSQSGILKGGASVTVSVRGAASDPASGATTVVVIASSGTVQLPAPTC